MRIQNILGIYIGLCRKNIGTEKEWYAIGGSIAEVIAKLW